MMMIWRGLMDWRWIGNARIVVMDWECEDSDDGLVIRGWDGGGGMRLLSVRHKRSKKKGGEMMMNLQ
jgi:hypothetical protein